MECCVDMSASLRLGDTQRGAMENFLMGTVEYAGSETKNMTAIQLKKKTVDKIRQEHAVWILIYSI